MKLCYHVEIFVLLLECGRILLDLVRVNMRIVSEGQGKRPEPSKKNLL